MGKNKVLVKVNPEGKYVVELDKVGGGRGGGAACSLRALPCAMHDFDVASACLPSPIASLCSLPCRLCTEVGH